VEQTRPGHAWWLLYRDMVSTCNIAVIKCMQDGCTFCQQHLGVLSRHAAARVTPQRAACCVAPCLRTPWSNSPSIMYFLALNHPALVCTVPVLQVKAAQQAAAAATSASGTLSNTPGLVCGSRPGSTAGGSNLEDLHGQVVRLKRHRDKLMRDQKELSRERAETRLELQSAHLKALDAQVRARMEIRMRMGALCVVSAHGGMHVNGSALCRQRAWTQACAWERSE
jgi:hypothetical protein